MSTKNKPVPYIDAQNISDSPAPVTRKVRFNPYTGGILSNANDRPAFGKYTMEIRSGTKFVAKMVNFKPSAGRSVSMQIPIPDVKLFIKNPNYDIMDSIVYLALNEDALAGVDNGGNFDQVTRQATGDDYYISFSPAKSSPVIKSTVTLELYDQIVKLFEKYTIYQFLELMTGKSYSEITNSDTLITLVQDNFHNLNLYAEAGFNNDSDSTADGYFIRNKLVTRFTFDKSYLDNPTLKSLNLRRDNINIYLDIGCESLQSVTFNLYAGPDTAFDFNSTSEFIAKYTINLGNQTNPTVKIPISNIKEPAYNALTAFQTDTQLNRLIFGRKCIAVKITEVKVAAGNNILASQFLERFGTNPTALQKTSTFTTNIPTPALATIVDPGAPLKQPYFLDLSLNRRKLYVKITQPRGGADPQNPSGLSGFLVKYIKNPNTATNAVRFFSFNNRQVTLMNGAGVLTSGTNTIEYYYEISDYFKSGGGNGSSFTLDIPYANQIQIYLVDNYYNVSSVPLKLAPPVYNTTNYFTTGGTAFIIGAKNFVLEQTNNFLPRNPRHTLRFTVQSSPIAKGQQAPNSSNVWTAVNGGAIYTYAYEHLLGYALDWTAAPVRLYDKDNNALSGVTLLSLFNKINPGQGYWIRLLLVDTYSTNLQKPNTGNLLGLYKKFK